MSATCLTICQLLVAVVAADWPEKDSDLHTLLRQHSPKYKAMSDAVQARQPYRFATTDVFLGNVRSEGKGLVIELNPKIAKDRRATILIWEMANAYQRDIFTEVHRRAVAGEITSKREYGLRMEMVEYDSHQHHLEVLQELSRAGFHVAENFLYLVSSKPGNLADYRIPSAHDYLDGNAKSGHTKHYEDWYERIPRQGVGSSEKK